MGASSAKEFGERHRIYEKSAGKDAKREQSVRCLGNQIATELHRTVGAAS